MNRLSRLFALDQELTHFAREPQFQHHCLFAVSDERYSSNEPVKILNHKEEAHQNSCHEKIILIRLFNRGGSRIIRRRGRHHTILPNFPKNSHKIDEKFGSGRGRRTGSGPFDPRLFNNH